MRDEDICAMYWLANVHKGYAGSSLLEGIFDTNSKTVMFGSEKYLGITKKISRVNHSCLPNAILRFDHPSFSFVLHAVREIGTGEEITISYVDYPTDLQSPPNATPTSNECTKSHIVQTTAAIHKPCKPGSTKLNDATALNDYFQNYFQRPGNDPIRILRKYYEARELATLMKNMKMEAYDEMITVITIACKVTSFIYPFWLDKDDNADFMKWAEKLAMAHEGNNGARYLEIARRNRGAGNM